MRIFGSRQRDQQPAPIRPWDWLPAPPDAFLRAELQRLHRVDLNFNNQWQLIGVKFVRKGGRFALALRWRCLSRVFWWLRCFAHILDPDGKTIGWMDHDLLDGVPPPAEWGPGDEGYEVRFSSLEISHLDYAGLCPPESTPPNGNGGVDPFRVRLGLYNPATDLRLPLLASTLPVADEYTAGLLPANSIPGSDYCFDFEPAPLVRCQVSFGDGIQMTDVSLARRGEVLWTRLRWRIRAAPTIGLRFFGHGVAVRDPEIATLLSLDQEMSIEQRGLRFEQDIVRAVPSHERNIKVLRAGVCTSVDLQRLPVVESTFDWDEQHRCVYMPIPDR